MRLYRYWADARATDDSSDPHFRTRCYAGSNESHADAEARAGERAEQLAEMLRNDVRPEYAYADRPLREEIIDEVAIGSRGLEIAITRNAYGALILNCSAALFADIDAPPPPRTGLIASLLGRKPPDPEDDVRERVGAVADDRGLGVRLYRTAAGFRALVTSDVFDPESADTAALLRAFHADPQYIRLCAVQASVPCAIDPEAVEVRPGTPSGPVSAPRRGSRRAIPGVGTHVRRSCGGICRMPSHRDVRP